MLSVVMLNGTNKPFVQSVIRLSVVRLNVVMLSVVAPFHISYEKSTIFVKICFGKFTQLKSFILLTQRVFKGSNLVSSSLACKY
jgi:hypothetical protein